jgi:hypothetical protein
MTGLDYPVRRYLQQGEICARRAYYPDPRQRPSSGARTHELLWVIQPNTQ